MLCNQGNRRRSAIWAALALGLGTVVGPAWAQDAGFGDKIPLGSAIKQIVPESYKVEMGEGVDSSSPVSWSGGGWKKALAGAAKGAGYAVVVTSDTVKVVKSASAKVDVPERAGVPAADAARVAPRRAERVRHAAIERHVERTAPRRRHLASAEPREEGVETVSGGGFVMLPVRAEAPVVSKDGPGRWRQPAGEPGPAAGGWVVRTGDNLQAVLRDWCAREGWSLVWKSEFSYELASSARFKGDFVSASGELLRSMSHARPVVTASFYQGNKTLVVGNENADEAGK